MDRTPPRARCADISLGCSLQMAGLYSTEFSLGLSLPCTFERISLDILAFTQHLMY